MTAPPPRARKPFIKLPSAETRVTNTEERQDELQKQHAKEFEKAREEIAPETEVPAQPAKEQAPRKDSHKDKGD
jgi:hypothetical protein